MQRKTYIRGNKKKKKIRQADFPAEAPESSSNKCETGNAEHSLHDFSSESPKECSLTEISESYEHAKNDGGAYQEKKHSAATSYPKKVISLSWFPKRQQALCPKREIFH
jgi:hypothetical protein